MLRVLKLKFFVNLILALLFQGYIFAEEVPANCQGYSISVERVVRCFQLTKGSMSSNRITGSISNKGEIVVHGKAYITQSGDLVLKFSGNELIGFAINKAIKDEILVPEDTVTGINDANKRKITADVTEITLTVKTASDAVKAVVNNKGIREAESIVERNGVIVFAGRNSGIVVNREETNDSSAQVEVNSKPVDVKSQYIKHTEFTNSIDRRDTRKIYFDSIAHILSKSNSLILTERVASPPVEKTAKIDIGR